MRLVRAGFELGMVLDSDKERPVPELDRFHQQPVRRHAAEDQPVLLKDLPVIIVEFVSVTVTLAY